MLGLTLRQEFKGKKMKGTAIELTETTQVPAEEFLRITYPTIDLLSALESLAPDNNRPLVLIGERGQGKSHLMSVLYHAATSPGTVNNWLQEWAPRLNRPDIAELKFREKAKVISANLNRETPKFLWDFVFDNHPVGDYIRGKWDIQGDKKGHAPSFDLLLELFQKLPTVLILDEFQTWFDGLPDKKGAPAKNWAFGFIQNLSELAGLYPELLALIVSVRNSSTDAYQQIHRINPKTIDFKGPSAKVERRRLLIHRLFENRLQISNPDIDQAIQKHLSEYFRLLQISPADQEQQKEEFIESWPFAPHLLRLLEDQVLVAIRTQETRDLIKVLGNLYKQNEREPIITAAQFQVDHDASAEIVSQLDVAAEQYHAKLREKAQRNLEAVREAVSTPQDIPHASAIVGSLWLRSLAPNELAGATAASLQVDITRDQAIDDNFFAAELQTIADNSFNIHKIGDRYVFQEVENPQTRLLAHARNDRLFEDGEDLQWLAKELRQVIAGSDTLAQQFRVIVLPRTWLTDPWSSLETAEHPNQWDDRLPILVIPEAIDKPNTRLGQWLKDHLQQRRNTVRFLLLKSGSLSLYFDRNLLIYARVILKAREWQQQNAEYKQEEKKYQKLLRDELKQRFDRVAILHKWNYGDPSRCEFDIEKLDKQGDKIPGAIEEKLNRDLFAEEDFEALVLQAAANGDSMGKILRELQEPRPNGEDCIPWLGSTPMKEKLGKLCAKGKISINLRGMEYLQAESGESVDTAWNRIKGKISGVSGKHLEETILLLPQAVPRSEGATIPSSSPHTATPTGNRGDTSNTPNTPNPTGRDGTDTYGRDGTGPATANPNDQTSIFDPIPKTTKHRQVPANAPLNLYAKVTDEWGITAGITVKNLRLTTDTLTGSQLQKLLKSLPEGLTYAIELDQEEN